MSVSEIDILAKMISINSENPPGGESEIVAFCAELLSTTSAEVSVVARDARRPNLIASLGRASDGPTLILQSHLDTKPAAHSGTRLDEWNSNPLEPVFSNDKIYGLGACDTKGGAAAYLTAFLEAAASSRVLKGRLVFQGVADEEHGSTFGAEVLLEEGLLKGNYALVAEPTDAIPSLAQFGNCWVQADVSGVAAHGGTPWIGCDAIALALELAELVQSMIERSDFPTLKGHPRLRIGGISGGGHAGTVASSCTMITDIRVLPGQSRQDYLAIWSRSLSEMSLKYPMAKIELSLFAGGGCEPHVIDVDSPFGRAVAKAWEKHAGRGSFCPITFFGGSDARYFAQAGTPAVVLGPGSLEQAHMPNEFVPISEVRRVKRLVADVIELLLY